MSNSPEDARRRFGPRWCARVVNVASSDIEEGARESRATASPMARLAKQKAGGSRHKVQPNHSAFPCVMVFDAYIVLSS
jgi:hypothetical protein